MYVTRQMGRTALFKGYGWDIYEETQDSRVYAFAHHKPTACQAYGTQRVQDTAPSKEDGVPTLVSQSWWLEDIRRECVMCGCKVPDNIQALVTLYVLGKETR